jgi:hypothetical protein
MPNCDRSLVSDDREVCDERRATRDVSESVRTLVEYVQRFSSQVASTWRSYGTWSETKSWPVGSMTALTARGRRSQLRMSSHHVDPKPHTSVSWHSSIAAVITRVVRLYTRSAGRIRQLVDTKQILLVPLSCLVDPTHPAYNPPADVSCPKTSSTSWPSI